MLENDIVCYESWEVVINLGQSQEASEKISQREPVGLVLSFKECVGFVGSERVEVIEVRMHIELCLYFGEEFWPMSKCCFPEIHKY